MKIVIDPGHGGKDPGALGSYSREKDINLILSLKLRDKLIAGGINAICTREDDRYIDLQTRCDIANNVEANYFISIHCNGAKDPRAGGTETYCYRRASEAYRLAQVLQNRMAAFNKNINRGVKTVGFYVLRHTRMPAVLIEAMFITNQQEEDKLNNAQWQEGFTGILTKAIYEYLGFPDGKARHFAQDAYEAWKVKGIILGEHDLDDPITWGQYLITQERLKTLEE